MIVPAKSPVTMCPPIPAMILSLLAAGLLHRMESQEDDSNPHPVYAIAFDCKTTKFMSPWQEEP